MRFELDFPLIEGNYLTRRRKVGWFSAAFPSLSFYRRMVSTVWRAAGLAKRGKYDDPSWCKSSFEILEALEHIGTQVSIQGLEHLSRLEGPCVIVGNHMSTLETFLLPYLVCPNKALTFVIKEALISYPVFKHIMISRDPVVVGRSNPKQDFLTVLKDGTDRLERGFSVVVFPQTTRMIDFDQSKFNSIGVKLAKKAKVPVVPLALKTDCWGNGTLIKDFGKIDPTKSIHFEFGRAMAIEATGKNQQEAIISHIENCLRRWSAENNG